MKLPALCLLAAASLYAGRVMAAPSMPIAALPACSAATADPASLGATLDPHKVLPIPNITDVNDHRRRCDVSQMSIAVRSNGQLRDIYVNRDGWRIPDDRSDIPDEKIPQQNSDYIAPVIANIQSRVEAQVEQEIFKAGPTVDRRQLESDLLAHPVKLLIYAHGGLVSHQAAVLSAESLAPVMMRDGYVPIFLIWNNDLPVSYKDRLCCVRNGSIDPNYPFNMYFFIPARLVADVGSSLASAPENFTQQVIRDKESRVDPNYDLYKLHYGDVSGKPGNVGDCYYFNTDPTGSSPCENIKFPAFGPLGADRNGAYYTYLLNGGGHDKAPVLASLYFPLGIVRVAATIVLPQVGANAWDNMLRRTRLAFDSEAEHCEGAGGISRTDEPLYCPNGGFTRFFNALCALVPTTKGGDRTVGLMAVQTRELGEVKIPVTIEFYGHSMGAIVGDELLSRYPKLPVSKIVYMAAADTIRDFKYATSGRFLYGGDVQFYSLSLHPMNEALEREYAGVVPEGSLLEWIDEMFNGPKTADDRTLGKWKNVEATLPTWDKDTLQHLHFRVFPAQNDLAESPDQAESGLFSAECDKNNAFGEGPHPPIICHPLKHGDFNHYSFWRPIYQVGADQGHGG